MIDLFIRLIRVLHSTSIHSWRSLHINIFLRSQSSIIEEKFVKSRRGPCFLSSSGPMLPSSLSETIISELL